MNTFARTLLLALAAMGILIAIACVGDSVTRSQDSTAWDLAALGIRLQREQDRHVFLVEQTEILKAACQRKDDLGDELIGARISLADAVAEFRALCENTSYFMDHVRATEEGATLNERAARHLIRWLELDLHELPACQAHEIRQRLARELTELIEREKRSVDRTLP